MYRAMKDQVEVRCSREGGSEENYFRSILYDYYTSSFLF